MFALPLPLNLTDLLAQTADLDQLVIVGKDNPDLITGLIGPGHNSLLREDDGPVRIAYHAWDARLTARRMFVDELSWEGTKPEVVERGIAQLD